MGSDNSDEENRDRVLAPDDLDITKQPEVEEIDDGRYVVSPNGPAKKPDRDLLENPDWLDDPDDEETAPEPQSDQPSRSHSPSPEQSGDPQQPSQSDPSTPRQPDEESTRQPGGRGGQSVPNSGRQDQQPPNARSGGGTQRSPDTRGGRNQQSPNAQSGDRNQQPPNAQSGGRNQQSTPTRSSPDQSSSGQSTPNQSSPDQSSSGQPTPTRSSPDQSSSGQSTPNQSTNRSQQADTGSRASDGSQPSAADQSGGRTPQPSSNELAAHDQPPVDPPAVELTNETVSKFLAKELTQGSGDYGFDATLNVEGQVNRGRMTSDDIGETLETLLRWYARQTTDEVEPETVLGIILAGTDLAVEYPVQSAYAMVKQHDLKPDDTISDLLDAVRKDGSFTVPPSKD